MNRVKIDLPASPSPFKMSIPVRITDMNYGNHLGNDRILTLCHEIRMSFLKKFKMSETNLCGSALIMSDAAIMFRGEAFYGDVIEASIYLDDVHKYGFNLYYQLNGPRTEVARVKTGLLFFDYELRKVREAPAEFENFVTMLRA